MKNVEWEILKWAGGPYMTKKNKHKQQKPKYSNTKTENLLSDQWCLNSDIQPQHVHKMLHFYCYTDIGSTGFLNHAHMEIIFICSTTEQEAIS